MNPAAPVSFFGKIPSTGKSISTDDAIAVIYLSGSTRSTWKFHVLYKNCNPVKNVYNLDFDSDEIAK